MRMFGLSIRSVMDARKLVVALPETSVREAGRLMKKAKVGAVLVVRAGELVGIFTERDAVYRVVAMDRDPRTTRLDEVMTPDPKTLSPEESFGRALLLMQENGFRHVPVIEAGHPVGVVSARNALDPDLEEFAAEAKRREHIHRRAERL
jgi:CBS domain-containing protein